MKYTCIVNANDTLLNYLLKQELPLTRTKLKSLLKHECISVDNEITTQFDDPISVGQKITIVGHNQQRDTPLTIIHEDNEILVIDKPYKLLTVANRKENELTAFRLASDYVKKQDSKNRIFVIHRLDQDTSGVVMFAKSELVQKKYQEQWNELVKERMYVAIVEGEFEQESGTVRSFLQENKTTHMYSTHTGQEAITHFHLIKKQPDFSCVKVWLDTGRKNQIRVHMLDLGHPIVGDRKYDAKSNPIKRMGLHAYRLQVVNPKTQKLMTFTAPLPPKFKRLMRLSYTQIQSI